MTVIELLQTVNYSVPMEIWLICSSDNIDDRDIYFVPILNEVGMYDKWSIPDHLGKAKVLDIRITANKRRGGLYVAADLPEKDFIECLWEKHTSRRIAFNNRKLLSDRVSDNVLKSMGWSDAHIANFKRECVRRCIR